MGGVPVYPQTIAEFLKEPTRIGLSRNPNGVGTEARFDCGCFFRFYLEIDEGNGRILAAGYESNGCGYMLAAGEWIAGALDGRLLTDLHGFDLVGEIASLQNLAQAAGRSRCVEAALEAARAAFRDHRTRRLERTDGETALICTCFGVSEESIEGFVKEHQPESLEEVISATRAGSGCGSCRMLIMEILETEAV